MVEQLLSPTHLLFLLLALTGLLWEARVRKR